MGEQGTVAAGPRRRGPSALHSSRVARERAVEQLVNIARAIGVVLGIVQFGLFEGYLPGTRPAGILFAFGYGATALWSRHRLATLEDFDRIRALTLQTLVLDTALLGSTAIVLAYQDDPTNLLLMVLPVLEAAMKRQVVGALACSLVAMVVEIGRVVTRTVVHDLPVEPAESTFLIGMLILIGLFAGGVTRQQIAAQDDLAVVNDRLSGALAVEAEMREAQRRLEGLRHDFVTITTHEIRTPVTVIKATIETLQSGAGTARREELLATADRQVDRLVRVLDDLEVVRRLDEAGVGVTARRLAVLPVVTSALDELGVHEPGRVVRTDLPDDLEVWADAALLQTVLRCLIQNALTHGGGQDVVVRGGHQDGETHLDVSDAGPGIPVQARARVFERFATVNTQHHQQGAGIGLPLARELTRLMGGDVLLLDEQRTTFRVRLRTDERQPVA